MKKERKMTVAEIEMEDRKLDDHFEEIMRIIEIDNSDCTESSEGRELDWWLEEYPTLECAETELLERHQKLETINREDFESSIDYLSECTVIDREIMMLEMTIDELYTDWIPEGAKHEEFKIGTIFRAGGGRFLCTDVGTRTVIAIRYTPRQPDNMNGPPYFMKETVWDEFDIEGVTILSQ
jgi:hypothetical protein